MSTLYPPSDPRWSGLIEVGEGHALYVEEAGNPAGIPVVFLHGGPGGGCKPGHRQFFDPLRYRSFLIDQRGAGKSTPYAGVEANTTQALVADLERIRQAHGVSRWVLFGGSWGAALALAYAASHPKRVLGMVLRGSFLARQRDLDWFLGPDGAARLLPLAWYNFVEATRDIGQTVAALHAALFGPDPGLALRVAEAWAQWSGEVVTYSFDQVTPEPAAASGEVLGKARIELHYARHQYFLRPNQLLDDLHKVPPVPVILIHGQRDITCPPEAAWQLHRGLAGSRLEILRAGGHLSGERLMQDALRRAADEMISLVVRS